MTREEEIKQAAIQIAKEWYCGPEDEFHSEVEKLEEMGKWVDEHPISGEQIIAMKNEIKYLKMLYEEVLHKYYETECRIRNLLISVKDKLPKESEKHKGWLSDTVFVITNQGDGTSARYDHATKTWCPAKILQGSITHWMPIPETVKGK